MHKLDGSIFFKPLLCSNGFCLLNFGQENKKYEFFLYYRRQESENFNWKA